jgi:hypothetical protein
MLAAQSHFISLIVNGRNLPEPFQANRIYWHNLGNNLICKHDQTDLALR